MGIADDKEVPSQLAESPKEGEETKKRKESNSWSPSSTLTLYWAITAPRQALLRLQQA